MAAAASIVSRPPMVIGAHPVPTGCSGRGTRRGCAPARLPLGFPALSEEGAAGVVDWWPTT